LLVAFACRLIGVWREPSATKPRPRDTEDAAAFAYGARYRPAPVIRLLRHALNF
jgi:hypothetical protein